MVIERAALLLVASALAAGCEATPPEGRLSCDVTTDCPSGWFCRTDRLCWRTAAAEDAGTTDARVPDGSGPIDTGLPPDASGADGGVGCAPEDVFTSMSPVDGLSTSAFEAMATFSEDELVAYLALGSELAQASRAKKGLGFSGRTLVTALNSPADETRPSLTADGLTLYFSTNRTPSNNYDIYVSRRDSAAEVFASTSPVDGLSSTQFEADAYVTVNGDLYFVMKNPSPPTDRRIVVARRTMTGAFAGPSVIAELDEPSSDQGWPVITRDERTIYFSSDVDGNDDIWMATRASASGTFGAPRAVEELNTSTMDVPNWISADGCRLYYSSDRGGTSDIWIASRAPR